MKQSTCSGKAKGVSEDSKPTEPCFRCIGTGKQTRFHVYAQGSGTHMTEEPCSKCNGSERQDGTDAKPKPKEPTKSFEGQVVHIMSMATTPAKRELATIAITSAHRTEVEREKQTAFKQGQLDCRTGGDPTNHVHFKAAVERIIGEPFTPESYEAKYGKGSYKRDAHEVSGYNACIKEMREQLKKGGVV